MFDRYKIERVCGECIEHWGEEAQFNQLGEECCELGAEINRFRRIGLHLKNYLKKQLMLCLWHFKWGTLTKNFLTIYWKKS